jgi:transcriptional regulator GlxA family with amidase domain
MLAQFVLFDGFDPLDVIAPYEVLLSAGALTGGALRSELVSAEGAREVPSGLAGVTLSATAALDPSEADIIIVPGAAGDLRPPEGMSPAEQEQLIPAILRRAAQTNLPGLVEEALNEGRTLVVAVCGGSLILAMAGLTKGRYVTTHRLGLADMKANFTETHVVDARVVVDDRLITAGGVTSGLDLALYLVEREIGPRIANELEKLFEHERRGTVWAPTGASLAFDL